MITSEWAFLKPDRSIARRPEYRITCAAPPDLAGKKIGHLVNSDQTAFLDTC
jgi:hypothetical protein